MIRNMIRNLVTLADDGTMVSPLFSSVTALSKAVFAPRTNEFVIRKLCRVCSTIRTREGRPLKRNSRTLSEIFADGLACTDSELLVGEFCCVATHE